MRFLNESQPPYDLTYSDVFMVPSLSAVPSRMDVDLTTPDGVGTTLPVVVANMTAVAGRRMAETVARRGGVAILPQDIPADIVEGVVGYVQSRHPVYDTPITLPPTGTVGEALSLIHKRSHGAVIVVDGDEPLGIFTEGDAAGFDRFTQLHHVMSRDLVVVDAATPLPEIFEQLADHRVSAAPVVEHGRLVGAITRKGALRSTLYTPNQDAHGGLRVGVAIGINGHPAVKAKAVLGLGVDLLVIDTAHGHQTRTLRAVEEVQGHRGRDGARRRRTAGDHRRRQRGDG